MQHWHDASDIPLSIYYGGCHQSDSRLVVMIVYLINHVLDEPVELERIRSNTGWVLCWPHLDYTKFLVEKEWEFKDALMEETWRIRGQQWCATQAKDTFTWLKELVLNGIDQFKKKQEAECLRKKEQDERYRKDIWCQSEQHGRDNARSRTSQSSRREESKIRFSSRSRPSTRDEPTWRKIDRKWAFSQSTDRSEVKDIHHGKAPESEGAVVQSERAQAEEQPEKEDDIDQDYDLTKSPFDPMEGYLGSEKEAMPAVGNKPALHDSLPRFVTETKYLIDLVPTQKEIVGDEQATEAVPEQSLSSSTTSSSETKEEGDDTDQGPADGEYRWRLTTRVLKAFKKMWVVAPRPTTPSPDWRKTSCWVERPWMPPLRRNPPCWPILQNPQLMRGSQQPGALRQPIWSRLTWTCQLLRNSMTFPRWRTAKPETRGQGGVTCIFWPHRPPDTQATHTQRGPTTWEDGPDADEEE